jgi:predicted CxxxxCH...CXXCH cytochrome family protein
VMATAPAQTCGSCHAAQDGGATAWATMSGPHQLHMQSATTIACADCHNQTTTDSTTIAAAGMPLHINGVKDVAFSVNTIAVGAQQNTCTGTCHGFQHTNTIWVGGPGGGSSGRYHPAGYAAPTSHGIDMELMRQDCRSCHGTTLAGGTYGSLPAPTCDNCHSGATNTAWRSNCTFCHGNSAVSATGMPPRDPGSSNTSVSQKFIAHSKHVSPTMMSANDCTTCHTKPTDVMSPHHAFDVVNGTNDVNLRGDGRNPMATFTGNGTGNATCSGLYCHGNGQAGSTGTYTDGLAPMTCVSCHGGDANNRTGMTGEHRSNHGGITCSECHNMTIATGNNASTTVSNPALHINGGVDVLFARGGTWNTTTKQCSPACHGSQTWR